MTVLPHLPRRQSAHLQRILARKPIGRKNLRPTPDQTEQQSRQRPPDAKRQFLRLRRRGTHGARSERRSRTDHWTGEGCGSEKGRRNREKYEECRYVSGRRLVVI